MPPDTVASAAEFNRERCSGPRVARSIGDLRQRASGRRRRAPRPVQGTSTRTLSKRRFPHGDAVASPTTTSTCAARPTA